MTEQSVIIGITGLLLGFMGNVVVMRKGFIPTETCKEKQAACLAERNAYFEVIEAKFDAIEQRLDNIETCLKTLKDDWKENYKAVCAMRATLDTVKLQREL